MTGFSPALKGVVSEPEAVQRMKPSAKQALAIGGPTLAVHAFKAGLVDVRHLFVAPIIVGDGNRAFPSGIRLELGAPG